MLLKQVLALVCLVLSCGTDGWGQPNLESYLAVVQSQKKQEKFLLVTGCGRSGTTYMTEFLQKSGLRVFHERMGEDGCVSWMTGADADWAPVGPLAKNFEFKHIFHQVRHPLKVIQSYYNSKPGVTWEWICSVIPEITMEDSVITRCAKYWYYWNLMVEEKAEWTYCIENFDKQYQEMGERLGLEFDEEILKSIPTTVNTRQQEDHVQITWKFLKENIDRKLYNKIRRLATRYGYKNNKGE